jgi:hypothetical protein
MLVDPEQGRMLQRTRFSDKHMRSLKKTWLSLLQSVQQEWPFFYGALLATVVENIYTLTGGKKVSGRKTDVELSLRWWTQDILSLLLGSVSRVEHNNQTLLLKKRRRLVRQHRVATIDRQRVISCVRSVGAVGTYGALLSSMLDVTMLEDVASTTRKMNGDVVEVEAKDAAQLLHLDSEMRELGGVAASSPRGSPTSGLSVETPKAAAANTPQLLSLEELESSIGMDLEEEEEQEDDEISADKVLKDQQRGTKEQGEEDDWVLCQSWVSCPIGHFIGEATH